MSASENTIHLTGTLEIYDSLYPESLISDKWEWNKISWVLGQGTETFKYLAHLYIDSYVPFNTKSTILSDRYKSVPGSTSEGKSNVLLVETVQSLNNYKFDGTLSLQKEWLSLFKEAVSPNGLKDFMKFLTQFYLIERKIDVDLGISTEKCSVNKRIENLSPLIDTFIYEWSATNAEIINGFFFIPGSVPFMGVDVLVLLSSKIYSVVDDSALSKYILDNFNRMKSLKATPTLFINRMLVGELYD